MRRLHAFALAVALVLAGCPGATSDVGTVTPAPVPTQPPPTEAPHVRTCGVPTPEPLRADGAAEAAGSPQQPVSPAAVPVENDTVNVTALLERHERRLLGNSYRIAAPGYSVDAAPNGSAYRVDAGTSVTPVHHYVVDDRRYTYISRHGGRDVYEVHALSGTRFDDAFGETISLSGRHWLADALDLATHRVETRRPDGWTVLRGAAVNHSEIDGRSVSVVDSTVLVDRRGVVRSVDQRLIVADDGTNRMLVRRFDVTDFGNTSIRAPSWLCDAVGGGHVAPEGT